MTFSRKTHFTLKILEKVGCPVPCKYLPRPNLLSFSPDAPINVGWGSKQTQFHGSLGKTAAQAPSTSKVGISPDDDNLPRISWRGDCAFFVVSSLSPASSAQAHRTLRVYNRQGLLQTTSEDVAGLEHPLIWRPSGNLIVATQRFGFEGGGAGREGRHDVIFFERNGLRHGEFSLNVHQIGVKDKGVDHGHDRRWGYKVRELAWNSDSNVLAIWIEGDGGDISKVSCPSILEPWFQLIQNSSILDDRKLSLVSLQRFS